MLQVFRRSHGSQLFVVGSQHPCQTLSHAVHGNSCLIRTSCWCDPNIGCSVLFISSALHCLIGQVFFCNSPPAPPPPPLMWFYVFYHSPLCILYVRIDCALLRVCLFQNTEAIFFFTFHCEYIQISKCVIDISKLYFFSKMFMQFKP